MAEDSQEGLKEVPASEILAKIEKGEPLIESLDAVLTSVGY